MLFEKPTTFINPRPEIQEETFHKQGKRIVTFNRRGYESVEKPSFEMMSYRNYLIREARSRGLEERGGFMVNPKTKKVDRGNKPVPI